MRAEACNRQAKHAQALQDALSAAEAQPRWVRALVMQASTLDMMGRLEEAAAVYDSAAKLAQAPDIADTAAAASCNTKARAIRSRLALASSTKGAGGGRSPPPPPIVGEERGTAVLRPR